jgi:hypothetical protein
MTQYVLEISKWLDFSFITDFAKMIVDKIYCAYKIRKTYNELYALSDHELRDIGINRGDIRAIAEGLF